MGLRSQAMDIAKWALRSMPGPVEDTLRTGIAAVRRMGWVPPAAPPPEPASSSLPPDLAARHDALASQVQALRTEIAELKDLVHGQGIAVVEAAGYMARSFLDIQTWVDGRQDALPAAVSAFIGRALAQVPPPAAILLAGERATAAGPMLVQLGYAPQREGAGATGPFRAAVAILDGPDGGGPDLLRRLEPGGVAVIARRHPAGGAPDAAPGALLVAGDGLDDPYELAVLRAP